MIKYDRRTVCAHLRSKNMYTDPDPMSPENTPSDLTESFWCNLTMRNMGPDDTRCSELRCISGRWCYRGIFDPPASG